MATQQPTALASFTTVFQSSVHSLSTACFDNLFSTVCPISIHPSHPTSTFRPILRHQVFKMVAFSHIALIAFVGLSSAQSAPSGGRPTGGRPSQGVRPSGTGGLPSGKWLITEYISTIS
jgi:hypothetical protein